MENNLKIIICVGLPASGKSSWSKNYIITHPNFVIVSRDSFRYMLKNSPVTEPKIEKAITDLVRYTTIRSLNARLNVILDATNLRMSDINEHINDFGEYADIEFMLFDVPAKTCIERDKNRQNQVGEEVIKRMNKDFLIIRDSLNYQGVKKRSVKRIVPDFNSELPQAVVFDLDGNLALMNKRSPYDWNRVDEDDVNEIVLEQLKFHEKLGRKIIIVSGRDGLALDKTKEWLDFYEIHYDYLFLKGKNDNRKDVIIKREIYNEKIKGQFNVICAYDDRLVVCRDVWHKNGIFCYCTNQGLKEF